MVLVTPENRNTVSPLFVLEHFEKNYFSILKKRNNVLNFQFPRNVTLSFQSFSICFCNKTSLKVTNAVLYTTCM